MVSVSGWIVCPLFFCNGGEPKSGLSRDLSGRLQFRNVPFGSSGDWENGESGVAGKTVTLLYIFRR